MTGILTLLLGPFMFWFLSHIVYSKSKLKKYPTQVNEGVGDIVFLPMFNWVLIELIISSSNNLNTLLLTISGIISIILTILYVNYQKNIANYLDWSKPKQEVLNFGGWYHAGFMMIQTIIIFYGLMLYYDNYILLGSFMGYIITVIIQIILKKYI